MVPGAGVPWGEGGRLQPGGPHSHPDLGSLRGAFGGFDLPLVAEHRGRGVHGPDLKGFRAHGLGAGWILPTHTLSPWRKGVLSLIIYFS